MLWRLGINTIAAVLSTGLAVLSSAHASEPAPYDADTTSTTTAMDDAVAPIRDYMTKRGFTNLTRAVAVNREALDARRVQLQDAVDRGGIAITGRKTIPVIMLSFSDTAIEPYPVAKLQKQLFESHPSGTMTDFYKENSYGVFTVTGTVSPWQRLTKTGDFYNGPITVDANGKKIPCNGIRCPAGKPTLSAMLTEALKLANKKIDFSRYDNDGVDGVANSGDDDGFVDFVAFVHPKIGGECGSRDGAVNNATWSHRWTLSSLAGQPFETTNRAKNGSKIMIDDYVIMPGLNCAGDKMIEIGVFAHEFGHAFGLPDLYDTTGKHWQGAGQWDLMGTGSWGGDGRSPHRPSHMAAWSKDFLGWINPMRVTREMPAAKLKPIENAPEAYRIDITADVYYLIEYRTKTGFDDSLTGPGLLLWRIDQKQVEAGLRSNSVNTDVNSPGVYLVQADGLRDLDDIARKNRGDFGDPFPGSNNRFNFDNDSNPATFGNFSLCNVRLSPDQATFDIRLTPRCAN